MKALSVFLGLKISEDCTLKLLNGIMGACYEGLFACGRVGVKRQGLHNTTPDNCIMSGYLWGSITALLNEAAQGTNEKMK